MIKDKSKKIRMACAGTAIVLMIVVMVYNYLSNSNSNPPVIISAPLSVDIDTSPIVDDRDSSSSLEITPIASNDGVTLPEIKQENNAPVQNVDSAPSATYQLSSKSRDILLALETTMMSKLNKEKLTAQIEEKNELQIYNSLVTPVNTTETSTTNVASYFPSTIDTLKVMSIVVTPVRTTAWVELEGERIPVKKGVWINDVQVEEITKNAIHLKTRTGKRATKYVPTMTKNSSAEVAKNELQ